MFLLQNQSHLIANFKKTRLCSIFAYMPSKNLEFLLSVCKIFPKFIFGTMVVPMFTNCIQDLTQMTERVKMCGGRSMVA